MFKKFSREANFSSIALAKSSVFRTIKSTILSDYSNSVLNTCNELENFVFLKSDNISIAKCKIHSNSDAEQSEYIHLNLIISNTTKKVCFFQFQVSLSFLFPKLIHKKNLKNFDKKPFIPTLPILHKYPDLLPCVQVDSGVIPFLLKSSSIKTIMCKGVTSEGGKLPEHNYPSGTVCSIKAQNKEHFIAIGVLLKSINEIKSVNNGSAIEVISVIGDGLFNISLLENFTS